MLRKPKIASQDLFNIAKNLCKADFVAINQGATHDQLKTKGAETHEVSLKDTAAKENAIVLSGMPWCCMKILTKTTQSLELLEGRVVFQ